LLIPHRNSFVFEEQRNAGEHFRPSEQGEPEQFRGGSRGTAKASDERTRVQQF
jgi:hypothetical protein